jgi:hypothetical protein
MGKAKLNVWVRTLDCLMISKASVTVVDCHGRMIAEASWDALPRELEVPPGCYIVRAHGCIFGQGNYESDRSLVMVRCGEEACVNLVVPTFAHCLKSIAGPFIENARRLKIPEVEIGKAMGVFAKAANIPQEELVKKIDLRLGDLKEATEGKDKEHLAVVKESMKFLKSIKF